VFLLTGQLIQDTVAAAQGNERRRVVQPLHRTEQDLLRRMVNALEPDSYVRPHRHTQPRAVEAWVVLKGSVSLLFFEDSGAVRDTVRVEATGEVFGVDFAGAAYHTVISLEPRTVLYEVKLGPYVPSSDKDLAPWAPPEGSKAGGLYLEELRIRSRDAR
jgi:cupin fold WbuC family metalloprotein